MTKVAVIGYGYWGRNIARDVNANPKLSLDYIVETDTSKFQSAIDLYPNTQIINDVDALPEELLEHGMIFVCVQPEYHNSILAELKEVCAKSVCVPKPFCLSLSDAVKYLDMVKMVDYTFLFSSAVKELPKYLDRIGMIYHVSCVRANLGKVQECGVLYDLTVHDLSILDHLGFHIEVPANKSAVSNLYADCLLSGIRGVYSNACTISIHNSWLSHLKRKKMVFTGANGVVVYDDNNPTDKITIYDKYIENPEDPELMQYKYGDTIIPYIPSNNPLGQMIETYRLYHRKNKVHPSVQIATRVHRTLEKIHNG